MSPKLGFVEQQDSIKKEYTTIISFSVKLDTLWHHTPGYGQGPVSSGSMLAW